MSRVYTCISQQIGSTPMLELANYQAHHGLGARLLAKLEGFNPAGSVKDRIARAMIENAEKRGLLRPGSVIIEPTCGNTGVALASVASSRGYQVMLTMPDFMTQRRKNMLKAYGAVLVVTDGKEGMRGAMKKALELSNSISGAFMPGQFSNPANPMIHKVTTGPEIWEATHGQVDVLVAGVGTGGTITGVGEYLREHNPKLKIVAVEPAGSPVLSKGIAGPHSIIGLGVGFVPPTLNRELIDEVITVTDAQALHTVNDLCAKEGILAGMSSGAAVWAAAQIARQPRFAGKTIVTVLPDRGKHFLAPVTIDAQKY